MPGLIFLLHLTLAQPALAEDGRPPRAMRQVRPPYPEEAKALDLGLVRCITRFLVDAQGVPSEVSITGCPEVFHPVLHEAAMGWRFYPAKDKEGREVPGEFILGVTFRLVGAARDSAPPPPSPAPIILETLREPGQVGDDA